MKVNVLLHHLNSILVLVFAVRFQIFFHYPQQFSRSFASNKRFWPTKDAAAKARLENNAAAKARTITQPTRRGAAYTARTMTMYNYAAYTARRSLRCAETTQSKTTKNNERAAHTARRSLHGAKIERTRCAAPCGLRSATRRPPAATSKKPATPLNYSKKRSENP